MAVNRGAARLALGMSVFAIGCVPSAPLTRATRRDAGIVWPDIGLRPDAALSGRSDDSGPGPLEPFGERLGAPVTASSPPPPIAGGTLLTSSAGHLAFVSDPEDDRVLVVDTGAFALIGQVSLAPGDEPGRLVLDAAGRLHVALRRGGAIATLDVSVPSAPSLQDRRAVCPAPRGIAYEPSSDHLYVACAGGELVELPASGAPTRTTWLPDDLRDVVVDGATLLVTRFRTAEVLIVDPSTGGVVSTLRMPETEAGMIPRTPGVAWRAVPRPGGGALVLHQRASVAVVDPSQPAAYGGSGCDGAVVQAAIAAVSAVEGAGVTPGLSCMPLVVDLAVSPDSLDVAVAVAGAAPLATAQFHVFAMTDVLSTSLDGAVPDASRDLAFDGRIVAIAYDAGGAIVAQTRDPAAIHVVSAGVDHVVALAGADHRDTGLDLFHSDVGAGIACASCHPEGGDDGHVWSFVVPAGGASVQRRTIPLRGGVSASAPYHWRGEFADMGSLLADVFATRMSGGPMDSGYQAALVAWLDSVPELPHRSVADAAAAERGRALFESVDVGCSACHGGALGSTEITVDVGTGDSFQVPSLRGVAYRAPYLHDGRAATLTDRFTSIGGGDAHGHTSQLDASQIADVVTYLETL